MKLITRDTDYALRAVQFIARQNGELVSVDTLVRLLGVPRPFLRKILQNLVHKRILNSYKGSGGGFLLAKPPEGIFLLKLIEIFQGKLSLNECFLKKSICPNVKTCLLHKKIKNIERHVISELEGITISGLLKGRV